MPSLLLIDHSDYSHRSSIPASVISTKDSKYAQRMEMVKEVDRQCSEATLDRKNEKELATA